MNNKKTDFSNLTIRHDLEDGLLRMCPFCTENQEDGAIELLETGDHETWYVICAECQCNGPAACTKEGAMELWNSRYAHPMEEDITETKVPRGDDKS